MYFPISAAIKYGIYLQQEGGRAWVFFPRGMSRGRSPRDIPASEGRYEKTGLTGLGVDILILTLRTVYKGSMMKIRED